MSTPLSSFSYKMAALLAGKDLGAVRVPFGGDKVYKDECIYCFDSPVSKNLAKES